MEEKYYSEKIEKDVRYRKDYLDGLESFLSAEQKNAQARREKFFDLNAYQTEQENYREAFADMLGFPLNLKRETPVLQEKTFVVKDKNVNIYRMQLLFWNQVKFYGLYFEQAEKDENTPFCIGLHGGEGTPELVSSIHLNSANYNHMVRRVTDRGVNVFVPQLLLWSTQNYGTEYDRIKLDGKLRQLGGSMTALELYLIRGAVDYFVEKENVNEEKIGCFGLSYGGMYALHAAALDKRIKSCYSCSWVNDSFVHSWTDWSYKNAQNSFTTAEVIGLVAPRKLVVARGDKDELFDSRLTQKECEQAKKFYRVFKAENAFKCVIFDGVHETDKNDTEMDFLIEGLEE